MSQINPYHRGLKSGATYWAPSGSDGFAPDFEPPVDVSRRWEEKTQLVTDNKGNEVLSTARVTVNRDLKVGGYLYDGDSGEADPTDVLGDESTQPPRKIISFNKKRNFKQTHSSREAFV